MAREFEVDEQCICRWRCKKANIEIMPLQKRTRSGIIKWPNLENNLAKWIKKQRENGISDSTKNSFTGSINGKTNEHK